MKKIFSTLLIFYAILALPSIAFADTLYENYTGAVQDDIRDDGALYKAEIIKPSSSHTATVVHLLMCRVGTGDNQTVQIWNTDQSGNPTSVITGASGSVNTSGASTNCTTGTDESVTMGTPPTLTSGTQYAVVAFGDGNATNGTHLLHEFTGGTADQFQTNSSNSGASWASQSPNTLWFEVFGNPAGGTTPPTYLPTPIVWFDN